MNDYIKREDALSEMAKAECGLGYEECNDCSCSYIGRIRDIPSADVRENVRGEWIHDEITINGNTIYTPNAKCSVCDCYVFQESNFCPNCGAEMRGES